MKIKKQRADSYEASLSEEELQLLHSLCLDRSLTLDQIKEAAPPFRGGEFDGSKPSTKALGLICTRLRTDQVMAEVQEARKLTDRLRKKMETVSVTDSEQLIDAMCELIGNEVIQKTVAGLDPKNRTAAARLLLKRADQKRFDQKFKQQLKSDLEKGLDALYETIKGVPEALAAFEQLKGVVGKATS